MSSRTDNPAQAAAPTYTLTDQDNTRTRSLLGEYWELTKPRLSMLSVMTAVVGYLAASPSRDMLTLGVVLIGTSLAAGAAGALNQYLERDADRRMARTQARPLPSGMLSAESALIFGLVLAFLGTALLWAGANALAALLVLATLVSYLLVYTPMKRHTSWCTIVGAIPGALPPLVGYAAASQTIGALGWILFGVLFCWQIPHFMAIAWSCRQDYANGGFVMATVSDPSGQSAGNQSIAFALLLLPISLLPCVLGYNNWFSYGIVAALAGAWFLHLSLRFRYAQEKEKAARRLFFASISYLPLVLAVFVLDRIFLV